MASGAWNPMVNHFLSGSNTYDAPEDGISDLAVDAAEMGGVRLCRFYREKQSCYKGQNCQFLHVFTGDGNPSVKTEALPLTAVHNERSLPKLSAKVVLLSTSVISPSFFYCMLPFDVFALNGLKSETQIILKMMEELTKEMTEHYSLDTKYKRNSSLFYVGETVAVECSVDSKYYRARILEERTSCGEKDPNRTEVMYMDFGSRDCVSWSKVRPLEYKFLQMPFQAIECSLSGLVSVGGGSSWPKEAVDLFKEQLTGKYLLAVVKSDGLRNHLVVDLWADGKDVGQLLVDAGLAIRAQATMGAQNTLAG